ncbi:hypothetical protein [Aeromicrobium sp. 179-A 4D2 NHS]|uniref:hypothetical protein n=1 Tax=Aeromicrobium sp. 179-A 4D2 NHS TaxID=3142375 RepID=UPI0039A3676F
MTDTTDQRRWIQREPGFLVRSGEEYAYKSGEKVMTSVAAFDFMVAKGVYIATPGVPVSALISDDPDDPTLAVVGTRDGRPVISQWFMDGSHLVPAEPVDDTPVELITSVEVVETYNPKTHVAVPMDPTPQMVTEALWVYEHAPAPSVIGGGGGRENLKKQFVEIVRAALIAGSQQ